MDDAKEKATHRYTVPALEKGLGILLLLGRSQGDMSFNEICRRMAMPKASVYRALCTLEDMGFLVRHVDSGGYMLGPSALRLGFDYLSSMDIVQIGQAVIHALRDATGHSAHLCVLDGRAVVYVARAAAVGEIGMGMGVGVGSRLPAHCTAIGRVLLMELPPEQLHALFPEKRFAQTSEQGPKTPRQLLELLRQDREHGYAISESFYQPGVSAVAYPLRDSERHIRASVSVMVPRSSLSQEQKRKLRASVAQAARDIEQMLHATG